LNLKKEVKYVIKRIGKNGYGSDKARRALKRIAQTTFKKKSKERERDGTGRRKRKFWEDNEVRW
jgi:hypothetical protein